jgi:ligand-binding sensor domain-containing protein/signal transduction histidine kinase
MAHGGLRRIVKQEANISLWSRHVVRFYDRWPDLAVQETLPSAGLFLIMVCMIHSKRANWPRARAGFLLGLVLLCLRFGVGELKAASAAEVSKYFFEGWPSAGGQDLNSVTAIVQTRDGYLWLGTFDGLVRFDGVDFSVFNSMNTSGLQNARITALFEDDAGVLWIGHETGELTRYSQGQFRPVSLGFSWVGGPIEAIAADHEGDLWLGSNGGGLFRLRDGHCGKPDEPEKGWPAWMARAKNRKLWVVSNGAIGSLGVGTFTPLRFDDDDNSTNKYERVLSARDGGWWVVRDRRIGKWKSGHWVEPLHPMVWTNDFASALLEMPSGSLLIGTFKSGLYLLGAGGAITHFTRADGMSSDQVGSLYEDREGNIWIGTGNGLDALRVRKVEMLNPPDQWGGHSVMSFWVRSDGSAWIGTKGAGLYHYEPSGSDALWSCFNQSNNLAAPWVWSVLETTKGQLLIGTWGGGLLVEKQGHFESPGALSKITAGVLALYESRAGELWIGTTVGLQNYANDKLTMIAGQKELSVADVRSITESSDATLWFGMSGGGLGSLKDGTLKQFRKHDGLSSDFVHCLYADADGTLWIGTADNGLCRLQKGKFSTISKGEGLPCSAVVHIVDDKNGNLWLGSEHGILRVSKTELNRCADGLERTIHCLGYGKAEGLDSQSCPGGFQPGACQASDGRLWFPTTRGIAIVDPTNVTTNRVPPPVVIEEFMVDGIVMKGLDVRVPPGKQRFELRYTGLSFAAPERVRFKYKLDGLESDWVEAGTRRIAQYSYLKPGQYSFHVIACNNDEVWNQTGASLEFTVQPHFWQTWWFIFAATAAGVGMVGGGVALVAHRRERRKLDQLEKQQAVEKERARIARDIHDDLGASLTRIAMLSQTMRKNLEGNSQEASAAERVSGIARELTRAMDEIVWAVNPKHDTLDSLATYLGGFAQDVLAPAGIRCRLNVPVSLPALAVTAEVRHNLFLAFKETLHNVLKHANASEVEISLETAPGGFTLIISDNGCGFALRPSNETGVGSDEKQRSGGGNGLINVRKRLEDLGGRCEWETAPGLGTHVRLVIVSAKTAR